MLQQIIEEIRERPNLSATETAKVMKAVKDAGLNVAELSDVLGCGRTKWWRMRKNNRVPRVIAILIELADKAQKYEEIKKI